MLSRLLLLAAFGLASIAPNVADAQTRARRTSPAATRSPTAQDRAAFERGLLGSRGGPIFVALRRNFPSDYNALIARLMGIAFAHRQNVASALPLMAREMTGMMQMLGPHLAHAPTDQLLAVLRLRTQLYETALRIDPVLCGRLVMQGNPAGGQLPGELATIASQGTIAIIDAAGAGRRIPVAGRVPFSGGDQAQVRANFERLDAGGNLGPLLDNPTALQAATPTLQCQLNIALYRSIPELEQDLAGRTAAYFIAEELQTLSALTGG